MVFSKKTLVLIGCFPLIEENVKIPKGPMLNLMSSHGRHIGCRLAKPNTILKGTNQGPFHKTLVKIGSAVLEELMKNI